MQGILSKWTNYANGWKKRFFSLEDGVLSYTKSESEVEYGVRGSIHLQQANITVDQHDNRYFIITGRNMMTFHLRAENYAERERWIIALRAAKMKVEEMQEHLSSTSENGETGSTVNSLSNNKPSMIDFYFMDEPIGRVLQAVLLQRDGLDTILESMVNLFEKDSKNATANNNIPKYLETFRASSQNMMNLLNEAIQKFQDREREWQRKWQKEAYRQRILEESLKVLAVENNQLEARVQIEEEEQDGEKIDLGLMDQDEFYDAEEEMAALVLSTQESMLNEGYGLEHRTMLPAKRSLIDISIWSVLKDAIGKDLTKISMPVIFNEPISMLQRLCEDLEYCQLLDKASLCDNSLDRMQYVAAFAISNYSSTTERTGKPFNPLLGETYELIKPERGFRYVAEQVSHHPPISACYCDSPNYVYWSDTSLRNKFWGKSLEIIPLGHCHTILKKFDEHYSWKKVTTCVNNLIVGTMWLDHYGEMEITNHRTKEKCIMKFIPRGWRGKNACELQGSIYTSQNKEVYRLTGKWNDKLVSNPLDSFTPSSNAMHDAKGKEDMAARRSSVFPILWKVVPRYPHAPDYYNFTKFTIEMNELPESLLPFLPPTDSRLRPDQRALEHGEKELATREKHRLEENQRARRRQMEATNQTFTPLWFHRDMDPDTQEPTWAFNHQYYLFRQEKRFDSCCVPIFE